jgi:hypothetical protein
MNMHGLTFLLGCVLAAARATPQSGPGDTDTVEQKLTQTLPAKEWTTLASRGSFATKGTETGSPLVVLASRLPSILAASSFPSHEEPPALLEDVAGSSTLTNDRRVPSHLIQLERSGK